VLNSMPEALTISGVRPTATISATIRPLGRRAVSQHRLARHVS
jgi:hypothetical protein